jgi:hypothetical protein
LHGVHRGVAAAFGVALCSLLLEKRLAVHGVLLGQHHDRFALPVEQSLDAFGRFLVQAGEVPQQVAAKSMAALEQVYTNHIRMSAYADCFLLLAIAFILALLPAYLTRDRAQQPHRAAAPQAVPSDARKPDTVQSA